MITRMVKYSFLLVLATMSWLGVFSQLSPLRFKMFEPGLLRWANIRTITLAKSGKLWLGTEQGLASFDGNGIVYLSQFNRAPNIAKGYQHIKTLADDGIGHLWFTIDDSLVKLDVITGKTFTKALPYFLCNTSKKYGGHTPYLDGEGKLWLGLGRNGFAI